MKYIIGAILLVSSSYALYDSYPDVIKLTPDNFDYLVMNSTDVWIVMMYAPWCGWSRRAVPDYAKVACALKDIAKLGAFDADEHSALSERFGVDRYPTIRVFPADIRIPYESKKGTALFIDAAMDAIKQRAMESLNEGECQSEDESSNSTSSSEGSCSTTSAPQTMISNALI